MMVMIFVIAVTVAVTWACVIATWVAAIRYLRFLDRRRALDGEGPIGVVPARAGVPVRNVYLYTPRVGRPLRRPSGASLPAGGGVPPVPGCLDRRVPGRIGSMRDNPIATVPIRDWPWYIKAWSISALVVLLGWIVLGLLWLA
jgi:hypothetical protein